MKFRTTAYFLLPLLASGCSQSGSGTPDELGAPIEFAAPLVVGAADVSRAQMLDALPEGEVFGVLGYCVPVTTLTEGEGDGAVSTTYPAYPAGASAWADKKASVMADVMYAQPIKFDGTKCVYRNADDTYYEPARWYTSTTTAPTDPATYRYTFIAYHPYGEGYFTLPAEDAVGAPKIGFTMPFESGVAAVQLDPTIVRDAMMATVTDHMRAHGTVALRFTHMLCGLRFQVNNYNTSDHVTIHSATLEGSFYRSGTVDYAPDAPTLTVDPDDTYTGTFTIAPDEQTVAANSSAVIGLSETQPRGTAVLLLPEFEGASEGTYLGQGKRLTIVYSFQGEENQTWTLDNFTIGRRPVQGNLYTVNLSFIGRQLTVTFNSAADGDTWAVDPDYDGDITIN